MTHIKTARAELLDFHAALANANGKRHLLLGNGFSRACRNDLFAYDALFDKARDSLSPSAMAAFNALSTTDFEIAMRALRQAAALVKAYGPDYGSLIAYFNADANSIRELLAEVIASNHPSRMHEISDEQFRSCRIFLKNFSTIYTLNYDLLLYWALMRDDIGHLPLKCDDGFRFPGGGPDDYVVWDFNDHAQNIYYLHGALHLFDAGAEVQKYTWSNTGIALVDQIRAALEQDRYPIYVSEGTSQSKLERVMHSSYLLRGYRSLSAIGGSLFIFGHSLQANDEHVLRCIENNKIGQLYVSIFGDPSSPENRHVMDRAQSLPAKRQKATRSKATPLDVMFYEATSANVWTG